MNDQVLLSQLEDRVLVLTLNRPDRRNAMNPALMRALTEALSGAEADARVGCVVLRGAGKGFCAGGDIGVAGDKNKSPTEKTAEQIEAEREAAEQRGPDTMERRVDWLRRSVEAARLLHQMPKPTVVAVHGAAAGAGFCLAAAADFRIVAQSASFVTSFVQVGFSGDYGGSYFLTQLLGSAKARELYLLGEKLDAQEAHRLGFVTRLVADDALQEQTLNFARRLAHGPGIAHRYIKQNLNAAMHSDLEEILDLESLNMTRTGMTEDHKEAAKAFFEKRKPSFRGC